MQQPFREPTSAAYAQAHALLKRANLRVTLTRILTMSVLMNETRPLSVDAIYQMLRDAGHDLSRASVYRAVTEFEKAGMAIQGWENVESGRMAYAQAPASTLRTSCTFACRLCGRTVQVEDKLLSQQLYYHALHAGFEQRVNEIEIRMACNDCRHE